MYRRILCVLQKNVRATPVRTRTCVDPNGTLRSLDNINKTHSATILSYKALDPRGLEVVVVRGSH